MRSKSQGSFYFSYWHPVVSSPFANKSIPSPVSYLDTFVKKCVCDFFWNLYSVTLIYIIRPSNSTHRFLTYRSENICPQKPYTGMLIAALLIIDPNWKQSKCPSEVNGWISYAYNWILLSNKKLLRQQQQGWISKRLH